MLRMRMRMDPFTKMASLSWSSTFYLPHHHHHRCPAPPNLSTTCNVAVSCNSAITAVASFTLSHCGDILSIQSSVNAGHYNRGSDGL